MDKKKIVIIVTIILLIFLTLAIGTYAWFTWNSTNNTSVTMSIGELADVTFNNGNDISTNSLAPVFDYTDGEKTTSKISNKSDTEITYKILLNINSIADELKNNNLKYKLLNGTNVVAEGDFSNITSNSNTAIYEGTLEKESVNFTFYLYIDGNEENDLSMMNKSIIGNITVEANEPFVKLLSHITNLYNKTSTVNDGQDNYDYDTTNNLMKDSSNNIRYYGANPNNYIYFNCDDYSNQTSDTCEIWRIIGIVDNQVKLIKGSYIERMAWDYDKNINSSTTTNDSNWITSTLNSFLNNNYLNRLADVTYYSMFITGEESSVIKTSEIGIKQDTRNLITTSTWYLGAGASAEVYSKDIYNLERTSTSINSGSSFTTSGKIAIPYASDYGYATEFGSDKCQKKLSDFDDTCKVNNWMASILTNNYSWLAWFLTPTLGETDQAWMSAAYGSLDVALMESGTKLPGNITPVIYIDSELKIKDGDGTSSNPYQLKTD